MTYAIILASIIFWALWRHWLGAEGTGPRWSKVTAAVLVTIVAFLYLRDWHMACWAVAGMTLYFLPPHDYGDDVALVPRYLGGGTGYTIARRLGVVQWSVWGEVFVGAWFGLWFGVALI